MIRVPYREVLIWLTVYILSVVVAFLIGRHWR